MHPLQPFSILVLFPAAAEVICFAVVQQWFLLWVNNASMINFFK